MNFEFPATTTTASTGFGFGMTSTPAAAKPPTLSFSATDASAVRPLNLGFGNIGPAANTGTATTNFAMPSAAPSATPTLGGFGMPPAAAVAPIAVAAAPARDLTGFNTAAAATTTATTGFNLGGSGGIGGFTTVAATTAASIAPSTGLGGFGAVPALAPATAPAPTPAATASIAPTATTTTSTGLPGFGQAAAAPRAATTAASILPSLTGFSVPATSATSATTTTAPGFALPKTTAMPTFGVGATAATSTVSGGTTTAAGTFTNLSTATKTTDSAVASTSMPQMTYHQLEEHINKWTLELEEQEKVFTDQATQINAWDKILISNNRNILELNDAVQKVKTDQQMLEQELEFIASQHKELEESIVPLEKQFTKLPQIDAERNQTYSLVENLDTQLKQMSEDLKEIIDNLNEASKGQDNNDPIIQIGKILNAHMSSLQWIEASSANIANKLEDLDKMHESFKRDSERSFRSAYYN